MSPIIWLCLLIPLAGGAPAPSELEIIPLRVTRITEELLLSRRNASSLMPRNPYDTLAIALDIGTPSKGFMLALNTASMKTFVEKVGFDKGTMGAKYYDPTKSDTSKSLNERFVYAEGPLVATGELYEDNMELYHMEAVVPFGAITQLKGLDKFYTDGQLGLGWTPYQEPEAPLPIIHSLLKGRPKKVYQMYTKPTHGGIVVGNSGIRQCIQHETTWLPFLKDMAVPRLTASSFEIGKYQYVANHRLSMDSSVSSIFMPTEPLRTLLKTYNAKFDTKRGVYLTDCQHDDHEWKITVGGKEIQITDEFAIVDIYLRDGRCALMVDESRYIGANKEQMYVLGMPFFYRYCVTFDIGGNQVGFSVSTAK